LTKIYTWKHKRETLKIIYTLKRLKLVNIRERLEKTLIFWKGKRWTWKRIYICATLERDLEKYSYLGNERE
jgi:hypothetical protein